MEINYTKVMGHRVRLRYFMCSVRRVPPNSVGGTGRQDRFNVLSVENPRLSKVLSCKSGIGENKASYDLPTANFSNNYLTFQVIHLHFFPKLSSTIM